MESKTMVCLQALLRIKILLVVGLSGVLTAVLPVATNQLTAADRDQVRIVGSSTVYPFSSAVAEEFGKATRFKTPNVESTGSGGGHKLFGAGVGLDFVDITNSSRAMKVSEFEAAQKNGVTKITEAVIGYDGIAFAQNKGNDPVNLTLEEITLAVAKEVPDPKGSGKLVANPYKFWDEINKSLPHREIKIYGPPTTSGTRDAFQELAMEAATKTMKGYDEPYMKVREDGVWIDSGEADNLIVQKLAVDKIAFGVFGYSFLEENVDKIQGAKVNGVEPEFETISSGEYPLSRSLFFYIKQDHLRVVPGMYDFVKLFMDDKMIGPQGQLRSLGLVPLPDHLRKASQQRVLKMDPLKLVDGKLNTLNQYAELNGFEKK
jgi:phosphate transport system substrate-binding protein